MTQPLYLAEGGLGSLEPKIMNELLSDPHKPQHEIGEKAVGSVKARLIQAVENNMRELRKAYALGPLGRQQYAINLRCRSRKPHCTRLNICTS